MRYPYKVNTASGRFLEYFKTKNEAVEFAEMAKQHVNQTLLVMYRPDRDRIVYEAYYDQPVWMADLGRE